MLLFLNFRNTVTDVELVLETGLLWVATIGSNTPFHYDAKTGDKVNEYVPSLLVNIAIVFNPIIAWIWLKCNPCILLDLMFVYYFCCCRYQIFLIQFPIQWELLVPKLIKSESLCTKILSMHVTISKWHHRECQAIVGNPSHTNNSPSSHTRHYCALLSHITLKQCNLIRTLYIYISVASTTSKQWNTFQTLLN